MGSGAQVNIVLIQLDQLLGEIRQETLKLLGKGKTPSVTEPSDRAYFDRLDGWSNRLERLKEQLKQMLRNVEGQRGFAGLCASSPELRRDAAYRTEQSIEDQAGNIKRAQEHAARVTDELESLLLRSLTPTRADLQRSVSDLVKKPLEFYENLHSLELRIQEAERTQALDAARARENSGRPCRTPACSTSARPGRPRLRPTTSPRPR
jgi:hypothetical protein